MVDLGGRAIDLGSAILGNGSSLPTTQQCNQSRQSGGEGVTSTYHELGRSGPTSFLLEWETYDVPDRIQVFYGVPKSTTPVVSVTASTKAPDRQW